MTIVTPQPTVARDRWGRPMVIPPKGGKPVAYTRCTSYIDVLDDRFALEQWKQRMVALGLAARPDLLLSVSAHKDDKKALNKVIDDAREAAAASAAATTGTALHALTELVDRGQELPPLPPGPKRSLEVYREATAELKAAHIETFCVLDSYKIGGTPDRIVRHGKGRYVADIKTGNIEWGALKIAMQLAIYARSNTYDPATHARGIHEADTRRGLVIHLPAVDDPAEARCDLHWFDLDAGWEAVQVARRVREQRRLKFADLATPFGAIEEPVDLMGLIDACTTADAVRDLWAAHESEWTEAHTSRARGHIAKLPAAV